MLNRDIKIAPRNADKKPSTSNPGIKYPTSINKRALTTREKIPKVNALIGNVMNVTAGFKEVLI